MRHPLGAGSLPGVNYHTTEVRKALSYCLHAWYSGDLQPERVNRRSEGGPDAALGLPLGDRMVTCLELATSLDRLKRSRPDLYLLVYYRYDLACSASQVAETFHLSREKLARLVDEALDWLVDVIFVDDSMNGHH